jgi:hypothetical protein
LSTRGLADRIFPKTASAGGHAHPSTYLRQSPQSVTFSIEQSINSPASIISVWPFLFKSNKDAKGGAHTVEAHRAALMFIKAFFNKDRESPC